MCLPHGVDIDKYQPNRDPAAITAKREALNVPADAVLIGLPGRVTPGKGQDIWVKALLELDPSLHFYALSIGGTDYASGGGGDIFMPSCSAPSRARRWRIRSPF